MTGTASSYLNDNSVPSRGGREVRVHRQHNPILPVALFHKMSGMILPVIEAKNTPCMNGDHESCRWFRIVECTVVMCPCECHPKMEG